MFERLRYRTRAAALRPAQAQVVRDVAALLAEPGPPVPLGPPPPRVPPSVFAVVVHASGTSLLTTKQTLVAFSHAIEQECRTGLDGARVFGTFQRTRYFVPARATWERMAAEADAAYVLGEFGDALPAQPSGPGPVLVGLDRSDPMRQEWAVVVDRPSGAMVLAAYERPDQDGVPDRERLFDSSWSTDPATVRRAAVVCATIAETHGADGAAALVDALAAPARHGSVDVALGERLLDVLLDSLLDSLPDSMEG